MCRHRFGVLNDLHNDLLLEGINDIKFLGMNGFQFLNPECDNEGESACSYHCMICDDECSATYTPCEDGSRVLPWTQDYDDGTNCQNENLSLCEASDEAGDIWDMWDITLRDLVILDREGRFITKINLTYTNPDPNTTCGENYETIKNLLISIRNQF